MPTKPLLATVTDYAWSLVTFAGRLEPSTVVLHGPSRRMSTVLVKYLTIPAASMLTVGDSIVTSDIACSADTSYGPLQ